MQYTNEQLAAARMAIAEGMTFALGVWFVPVPIAGSMACNVAETTMIEGILRGLGKPAREEDVKRYFWFFRKKYFLVNVITFLPYVGATVQLLEVYALGQFVLTCCDGGVSISDERSLERAWNTIEPKIWQAEEVIAFYESASGAAFPANVRDPFVSAVAQIGKVAQGINRIPGMAATQAFVGDATREISELAGGALKEGWKGIKKLWG